MQHASEPLAERQQAMVIALTKAEYRLLVDQAENIVEVSEWVLIAIFSMFIQVVSELMVRRSASLPGV